MIKPKDYKIIVDDRESLVILELKSKGLPHEVERLSVGDILIKHKPSFYWTPLCVIERKTLKDYANSIINRRIHNQLNNLVSQRIKYPGIMLIVLCEGYRKSDIMLFKSIESSIILNMFNRGIYTHRVNDLEETIGYIYNIGSNIRHIIQGDRDFISRRNISIRSKMNISHEDCLISQLNQIPSISREGARGVCMVYKSMGELITKYNSVKGLRQKMILLQWIKLGKGRLGISKSINVYNYLFSREIPNLYSCKKGRLEDIVHERNIEVCGKKTRAELIAMIYDSF